MNSNTEQLEIMLIRDEGFRGELYQDTEGFNTIGIGFCLDRIRMPEKVARFWLRLLLEGIKSHISQCDDIYPIYKDLNPERQLAILNMAYQMGVTGVRGFRKMWGYLETGDYYNAAREALDSVWATQSNLRANRISEVIRTGTLESYT